MKSSEKLSKLADKFELKVKRAQSETLGVTQLFFGDDPNKQQAFNNAIQDQKGAIYKILESTYMKTEKPTSFNLKVNMAPGQGASWVLNTNPPTLKAQLAPALNAVYQKVVGGSMDAVAKAAAAKLKAAGPGAGSPLSVDVGSLDLS